MGWYSNKLDEGRQTSYYSVEGKNVYTRDSSANMHPDSPIVWQYFGPADSVTIEKLKRQKTIWITIDGYKTKLVTPKKTGVGLTGIYIDSLWQGGSDKVRFVLSAHNLTAIQQAQFIEAIKTLKFNRPKSKQASPINIGKNSLKSRNSW